MERLTRVVIDRLKPQEIPAVAVAQTVDEAIALSKNKSAPQVITFKDSIVPPALELPKTTTETSSPAEQKKPGIPFDEVDEANIFTIPTEATSLAAEQVIANFLGHPLPEISQEPRPTTPSRRTSPRELFANFYNKLTPTRLTTSQRRVHAGD